MLVEARDDLSVEVATLLNQVDRPARLCIFCLAGISSHGKAERAWYSVSMCARSCCSAVAPSIRQILLKRASHFFAALQPPQNLSEAKHLLTNQSDIHFWIGESFHRSGDDENARVWWLRAARQKNDFQQMSVQDISDMTFWTGLALGAWAGRRGYGLFTRIHDYSIELEQTQPKIDYFATSLPAMLLFNEDLVQRNHIDALFLRAQALIGLSRIAESQSLLEEVLNLDRSHAGASDLLKQLGNFNNGSVR